jgi:hypothetical protein
MDCQALKDALGNYGTGQAPNGVESLALNVAKQAQDGMDEGIVQVRACDLANLRLLLNMTVTALAAAIAEMYQVDLESFANRIVDSSRAVITKQCVDVNRKQLLRVQQAFLNDMLDFLDGQRDEEGFCIWPYGNLEEAEA